MAIKVLLVDDDPMLADMYSRKFTSLGLNFAVLTNPDDDLISKVIKIKPDIILMDILFGADQSNGVKAAELLQTEPKTSRIPIIFITNAQDEKLAEKAKKVPSSIGFFVKALSTPSELVAKVNELYAEFEKKK
jgi:CheY-like chemotaxis protein